MKKAFNIAARAVPAALLAGALLLFGAAELKTHQIESADPQGRPMTSGEVVMAQGVFGDTINYNTVRLHKAPDKGDLAVTDGNDIYFETAALHDSDFSAPGVGPSKKAALMHELEHVHQHQGKGGFVTSLKTLPGHMQYFLIGDTSVYKISGVPDKKFADMNEEQQAVMVAAYFNAKATLETPPCVAAANDPQNIVCAGARAQVEAFAPRLRDSLPLPGAGPSAGR